MNQHFPDLPKIITGAKDGAERALNKHYRPDHLYTFCGWALAVFNILMAAPVVIKMITTNVYSPEHHYLVIGAFCISFAAIALINKRIINREKDDV